MSFFVISSVAESSRSSVKWNRRSVTAHFRGGRFATDLKNQFESEGNFFRPIPRRYLP